jgi:predicted enzyme related to lactoylglutathione lyase
MTVLETFFVIEVSDMERATTFYVEALGATATYTSPRWSSLHVAGARVGLFLNPDHAPRRVGLHFVVTDLGAARADVERAGGRAFGGPIEVAPSVVLADAADSEGNTFSLRSS